MHFFRVPLYNGSLMNFIIIYFQFSIELFKHKLPYIKKVEVKLNLKNRRGQVIIFIVHYFV